MTMPEEAAGVTFARVTGARVTGTDQALSILDTPARSFLRLRSPEAMRPNGSRRFGPKRSPPRHMSSKFIFAAIATASDVVKADSFCRRLRQCISTVGKEIFSS